MFFSLCMRQISGGNFSMYIFSNNQRVEQTNYDSRIQKKRRNIKFCLINYNSVEDKNFIIKFFTYCVYIFCCSVCIEQKKNDSLIFLENYKRQKSKKKLFFYYEEN